MKKNITYISSSEFVAIVSALGLTATPQKGFLKVSGAEGRNVYVASTKEVGRVDLSGFTLEHGGQLEDLGDRSYGNVHQRLRFEGSRTEILEAFTAVLLHMKALGPVEAKPRRAPAKGQTVAPLSDEDRADLIAKASFSMGSTPGSLRAQ